jgi:hypothetical protein
MLFYPTPNQAAKQKMSFGDNEMPAGFHGACGSLQFRFQKILPHPPGTE